MANTFWHKINTVYIIVFVVLSVLWLTQLHSVGIVVGLSGIAISVFIYYKKRWAYFAAAILCFGLFRIAMDDGYDFYQGYQSIAKLVYIVLLVLGIVLHEKCARKPESSSVVQKPE